MITCRKVYVVSSVAAACGTHIACVERFFEGKDDAVERHAFQIWIRAKRSVQLSRLLKSVRQSAKKFADRRHRRQQRPVGRVQIKISAATERSPRIFNVASAFTCRSSECRQSYRTVVAPKDWKQLRPYSICGPRYLSRSGRMSEAFTVWVGKLIGAKQRAAPIASGTDAPSFVTSILHTPLKARTRFI